MGHEIVSLHLGSYANHVAAHFWNLQDELLGYTEREDWRDVAAEVNHSILFNVRESNRQGGLSYLPRALFVDLSGSLGGVRFGPSAISDPLQQQQSNVPTWAGQVQVHAAPRVPASSFVQRLHEQAALTGEEGEAELEAHQAALEQAALELDSERVVATWTDYLKVQLTPSCVSMLPGIWQGVADFGCFTDGAAALGGDGPAGGEFREELVDRVRVMCEECDLLQGFQVFADDLSGFGSVAHALLEELRGDYPGREVLVFSVRQPPEGQPGAGAALRRVVNEALATALLPDLCSLYVPLAAPSDPLALPHLRYRLSNPFHTGAILASAIDSVTFPARLYPGAAVGAANLHSLVRMLLGRGGANLGAAAMFLPCPPVPADLHQAQAAADTRVSSWAAAVAAATASGAREAAAASGSGAAAPPELLGLMGLERMAALTPGVEDRAEDCLAESLTLRGARCSGGGAGAAAGGGGGAASSSSVAASTSQALSALDASLLRGGARRCVRARCVSALPLAVPLPFPGRLFRGSVGPAGELLSHTAAAAAAPSSRAGVTGGSGQGGGGGGAPVGEGAPSPVETAPVLTKLTTTRGFAPKLQQLADQWVGLRRSSAGMAMLDGCGYGGGEAQEVQEALVGLAAAYADSDEEGLE